MTMPSENVEQDVVKEPLADATEPQTAEQGPEPKVEEEEEAKPDATPEESSEKSEDEATTEEEEEAGDESNEQDAEDLKHAQSFIEGLAAKLVEADPTRWDGLQELFYNDKPLSQEDYQWMTETLGLDEAVVRYGVTLQRQVFRSQKGKLQEEADAATFDIDKELNGTGDGTALKALREYVSIHAPKEKLLYWNNVLEFAEKSQDNEIAKSVMRELQAFRTEHSNSQPGPKVAPKTTLGHLAAAAGPKTPDTVAEQDNTPVAENLPKGPGANEALLQELRLMSTNNLSNLTLGTSATPAVKHHALLILAERGVIKLNQDGPAT